MKNVWISVVLLLLFSTTKAQDAETILMTIGDKEITKGEFEYIFNKNNSASQDGQTTLKDYVDMFVKFKLKVIEAENRGLDTTSSFTTELNGYREQLAKPYLIDQKLSDELIETAYHRLTNEVNASHILIRLQETPRPSDTLMAYNKIMDIRARALKGESFEELAKNNSDDPSAKMNGGNLNYFSGFQMVLPFEEAAYNTPVGEISMPIRTRYGYHIIKVNDVRKSRGDVKVAHILYLANEEMSEAELANLKVKADKAYEKVKLNPEDFGKIAKAESDDFQSAENDGELNWFSTGQMVYEFQEVAYNLKKGEISKPFQTQFGWHIVKKLDQRPYASFEDKKDEIKQMLARTERGKQPEESFINKLIAEYGYTKHEENVDEFVEFSKKYRYTDSLFYTTTRGLEKPVITLDSVGVSFSQEHFADYLINEDSRGEVPSEEERVKRKYDRYYRKTLTNFENSQLERKYPDFRYLMQEYHDGILLFEISQKEIWNKASIDTAGLEKFYPKVKKKYPWETEHFTGKIYYCADDSIRNIVQALLQAKKSDHAILDSLNKVAPMVNIDEGIYGPGHNAAVDSLVFAGSTNIEAYHHFKTGIAVGKKDKPGVPKELKFVRGAVISDYQDYLEQNWVKDLKKKYKVLINKKVLSTVTIKNAE